MLSKINDLITSSDGLIIAAGAGMSVDSGLPDFRGNEGLWQHYPPLKGLNIDFRRIADPLAFDEDPTLAWGFYGHRLLSYRNTQPHEGFDLLKKLGEQFKHGSFVFTSNVDGQFQKAGFNRQRIYECHGSIHSLQCTRPDGCGSDIWSAIDFNPVVDDRSCELVSPLPSCINCGELARPNIFMFEDWYWQSWLYKQQKKNLDQWLSNIKSPLVIEIGAGVTITTVRRFSEKISNNGERLIRINPIDAAIHSAKGISLPMGGLAGIKAIVQVQQSDVAAS